MADTEMRLGFNGEVLALFVEPPVGESIKIEFPTLEAADQLADRIKEAVTRARAMLALRPKVEVVQG